MKPTVSVVIKSYNHDAYVGQALQSILDQSFQDFEILVVDDGSTDKTPETISRFRDPRIHFEAFPQNRGISIAMNSLIARSKGEYIAILNSDDFALPGRLEKQVAFLRANPECSAVFGLPRPVDENNRPTKPFNDFFMPFALPNFSSASWLKFFFLKSNCLCAPTAMVRRSAYSQAGPYDPRLTNMQDLDMWVRISTIGALHVMRDELTAFRIRAKNRNLSAPRRDTLLRAHFEYSRILRRYRKMDSRFLLGVFADELAAHSISPQEPHDLWLAELALTANWPSHRLFAIETMYEVAHRDSDYRRLRELTGSVELLATPRGLTRAALFLARSRRCIRTLLRQNIT